MSLGGSRRWHRRAQGLVPTSNVVTGDRVRHLGRSRLPATPGGGSTVSEGIGGPCSTHGPGGASAREGCRPGWGHGDGLLGLLPALPEGGVDVGVVVDEGVVFPAVLV